MKEKGLCDRLALPPHDTSIFEIPTETELKEIEANILYMEKELVRYAFVQTALLRSASLCYAIG